MKISLLPTKKLAVLCGTICAAMLAFSHNAQALAIGDSQTLGYVFYGIPSGDQDRTNYTNHLIFMYNNGITDDSGPFGQDYHIVNGAPAFGTSLPNAVFAMNGTGTSINLGTGLYTYLFAKYDGPNQGSIVWYVGNLSGMITIPNTWGQYGLSGWTLFGPGGGGVPDGGTSVMLLSMAFGGLGIARRFLRI